MTTVRLLVDADPFRAGTVGSVTATYSEEFPWEFSVEGHGIKVWIRGDEFETVDP